MAQIRIGLGQGQVKRLEVIPNDGNSEDHATKRHENICWREITMWRAQKHAKENRNDRYKGQGPKKMRVKFWKVAMCWG